jgi:hypothetical protein
VSLLTIADIKNSKKYLYSWSLFILEHKIQELTSLTFQTDVFMFSNMFPNVKEKRNNTTCGLFYVSSFSKRVGVKWCIMNSNSVSEMVPHLFSQA